jgi:membrane fusion protein, multidrug efflux system
MRNPVRWCLISMAGFAVGIAGCEKAPAPVAPPPPKVSVAHAEMRDMVDYDNYNGWLQAAEVVEVRARVRGEIQKIDFTDGQIVQQGDPLIELDPRPFESDVARQQSQKAIYQAQQVAAQKEYARLSDLAGRGGASQSQVEKALADAQALEAQIDAASQDIIRAQLDLEYSKITAAITGRISRALLSVGNLVNAGGSDPLLTTIVSIDPVYVYFTVDERAMQNYMKFLTVEGETTRPSSLAEAKIKIRFGLDTDEGYPNEALVDFADNQVDRATGTILARAVYHDPTGRLTPGSRVRIRIPTSAEHSVALVPDTAILTDQDKKYLLVLDDKNVVQRRDINPGKLLDDGMRVILPTANGPGVAPGEWIIVDGLQIARLNYPVEPVPPATQPSADEPASAGQ